jgi:hypothetical protein
MSAIKPSAISCTVADLIEQDVLHQPRPDGVDAFKWLVHQIQLRPVDQGRRHSHPLAHTFGIFRDQLLRHVAQLK